MPNEIFSKKRLVRCSFVLCIILIAIYLAIFNCSFETPSAPKWELDLKVPLLSDTYCISELIENNDFITADSNGNDENVYLHIEKQIERFQMHDRLKINAVKENFESELGFFNIDAPGRQSTTLTLRDLNPELDAFSGQKMVVQPFSIEPAATALPEYPGFWWVKIDSGGALVTLKNETSITLGKPLIVELKNSQSGDIIGIIRFEQEIMPGDSASSYFDLAGKTLTNQLTVRLSGSSAGSKGEIVSIDPSQKIYISMNIGKLKVSEAAAAIPAQSFKRKNKIALSDSIKVSEARIKQGSFLIEVGMAAPLDAVMIYEMPDLYDTENRILRDSIYIVNKQKTQRAVILDNYNLRPEFDGIGEQKLRLNTWFNINSTGSEIVALKSSDNIWSTIDISEIKLKSLTGIISEIKVEIDPISEELDIPLELDSLTLVNAELRFEIINSINFPAAADLKIEGKNQSGNSVPLHVQEKIDASAIPGETRVTSILLDNENSDIVPFINSIPDQIDVFGSIEIGSENWVGTITEDDYIEGTFTISSPLAFILPAQEVETEVDTIELDADVRDKVPKYVKSGFIYGTIENHLPFDVNLQIMLSAVDSLVYTSPDVVLGPVTVQSGEIDSESGYTASSRNSEIRLEMTGEDIKVFENKTLYAGIKIELPGSNNEVIRANKADFISISLGSLFRVLLDFDDNENHE